MHKSHKTGIDKGICFPFFLGSKHKERCKLSSEPKILESTLYFNDGFGTRLNGLEGARPVYTASPNPNASINLVPDTPLELLEFLSRSWNPSSVEVIEALSRPNGDNNYLSNAGPNLQNFGRNHLSSPTDEPAILPLESQKIGYEDFSSNISPELKGWPSIERWRPPDLNVGRSNEKKSLRRRMGSMMKQADAVRSWVKNSKEKKKEEARLQAAEAHAAVSVAGVAVAIAAFAAAGSINMSVNNRDTKTDIAFASAAALVAAQCVEVAAMMGAHHQQISSVINSAACVKSAADIQTLTAAAATSLRGAETLKSRPKRAAVMGGRSMHARDRSPFDMFSSSKEDRSCFFTSADILLKGAQILTREINGKPRWKTVCFYLNKDWEVMLQLKTKKCGVSIANKESLVLDLVPSVEKWLERRSARGGEKFFYFGLKTSSGNVEFELKDEYNHQIWIFAISRLLEISHQKTGK